MAVQMAAKMVLMYDDKKALKKVMMSVVTVVYARDD
jgi:hypothetical protein